MTVDLDIQTQKKWLFMKTVSVKERIQVPCMDTSCESISEESRIRILAGEMTRML